MHEQDRYRPTRVIENRGFFGGYMPNLISEYLADLEAFAERIKRTLHLA